MILMPADRIACDQQKIPACVSILPHPFILISVSQQFRPQINRAFSGARQPVTIVSSHPPENVAGLISISGRMLVLLLVHKTRVADQSLVRRIYNIARYAQRSTMNLRTTATSTMDNRKW